MEVPSDVMWQSFAGAQRRFTIGDDLARRYEPGNSAILAFANSTTPSFESAAQVCEVGQEFYVDGWTGEPPASWEVVREAPLLKMIWDGRACDQKDDSTIVQLGAVDAPEALELAILTNPGPFGLRTMELGDYFGVRIEGRLAAMAGERMEVPPLREVSAVCTHPDFRGLGLARRLTLHVVARELARGEVPFLHAISTNVTACGLYRRLGFRDGLESVARVVRRIA